MSTRTARSSTLESRALDANTRYFVDPWVRNPTWLAMPGTIASDERVDMLVAIYPESNFIAFTFTLTAGGSYYVDWGDGTNSTHASNTTAQKQFDYTSPALDDTDGPVTFQGSGDTVTRTNHGYTNGMTISFASITTTTGITAGSTYYVVNATANTFQLSLTSGGSVIDLVNDGSGKILPYKQAIVSVTPNIGGTTFTVVTLPVKHSQTNLQAYAQQHLDLTVAASATTMSISSTSVPMRMLERARILRHSATSFASLFTNASRLRVVEATTSGVTSFSNTFNSCVSLSVAPDFSYSSATTLSNMFNGCGSLQYIGSINAPSCTDVSSMFASCLSLRRTGTFNFGNITTTSSMFSSCQALQFAPYFNTATVTNMSSMFNSCSSLVSVPLYNTASVTNASGMFQSCRALLSVPRFNFTSNTNFSNMFNGCSSLTEVPDLATPAATNMQAMFANCTALVNAPMMDVNGVSDASSLFNGCGSLLNIPAYDFSTVTTLASTFNNCYSLLSAPVINAPSCTSMAATFTNCNSLTWIPDITTSASLTALNGVFNGCSSLRFAPRISNTSGVTNWVSAFLNCTSLESIPEYTTSAATTFNGMFSTCSSLSSVPAINAGAAVTSSTGYTSMFSSCPSLSSIKATGFKFTFTVASCKLSGTALNELYTNLASVSAQTITVSSNYGTTGDDPTIATAKGWTVTGS